MTKDEIIKLAIEHTIHGLKFDEDGLLRFAALVASAEREECSKLARKYGGDWAEDAIRARVEK